LEAPLVNTGWPAESKDPTTPLLPPTAPMHQP